LSADGQLNTTIYVMPTSELELAWASMQFMVSTCALYVFSYENAACVLLSRLNYL